jgi:hypothetical protein
MIMQPDPLFIQLDDREHPSLVLGWDVDEHGAMRPEVLHMVGGVSVHYRVGVDEPWYVVSPLAP